MNNGPWAWEGAGPRPFYTDIGHCLSILSCVHIDILSVSLPKLFSVISQYFDHLFTVVVRSRNMPVPVPSNLREREVAAAVKHLAAANIRGSAGVDIGDYMAVIEDYFCGGKPATGVDDADSDLGSDFESDNDVDMVMDSEEEEEVGEREIVLNGVEDLAGELAKEIEDHHASKDQSVEIQKVRNFKCGCSTEPCKALIDDEDIVSQRYAMLELSKTEQEIAIMAQLNACTNFAPTTCCTKRKEQTERKLNRTVYYFHGQRICREMFCFLHW